MVEEKFGYVNERAREFSANLAKCLHVDARLPEDVIHMKTICDERGRYIFFNMHGTAVLIENAGNYSPMAGGESLEISFGALEDTSLRRAKQTLTQMTGFEFHKEDK